MDEKKKKKKRKRGVVRKRDRADPSQICSQHILFDGVVIVLRAVDLGDRDLRVLIVALPALRRLLHFANLTLGGRVHYTVYVRHRCALIRACSARDAAKDIRSRLLAFHGETRSEMREKPEGIPERPEGKDDEKRRRKRKKKKKKR